MSFVCCLLGTTLPSNFGSIFVDDRVELLEIKLLVATVQRRLNYLSHHRNDLTTQSRRGGFNLHRDDRIVKGFSDHKEAISGVSGDANSLLVERVELPAFDGSGILRYG